MDIIGLLSQEKGIEMSELGDRLLSERKRLALSQTDFAELGSVTKNTQFLYETNKRKPTGEYLMGVAEAGVDVLFVLTGRETPEAEASLAKDEKTLVRAYRTMEKTGQSSLLELASLAAAGTSAGAEVEHKN